MLLHTVLEGFYFDRTESSSFVFLALLRDLSPNESSPRRNVLLCRFRMDVHNRPFSEVVSKMHALKHSWRTGTRQPFSGKRGAK